MTTTELIRGDCREVMRTLPTASAACVVTDGPYEYDLMGQSWDRDSAVFEPDTWREVRRVVSPGGYVAAFGGPRTWHHLTLALEQGGLRIVTTLAWIYSDGNCTNRDTQLKTGFEPIVLAQVPAKGSLKAAVAEHGTGHLQIDDCRLPYMDDEDLRLTLQKNPGKTGTFTSGMYGADRPQQRVNPAGRHPANVVIDERVAQALGRDARFFLCPKASPKERDAGLSLAAGIAKNAHTCLLPGELVLTRYGYRPIASIQAGETVLADDGTFCEVTDVFSTPCKGDVHTVRVDGTNRSLTTTAEHLYLIWRPRRKQKSIVGGEVSWMRADDIEVGDYTMTAIATHAAPPRQYTPRWWFTAGLWVAEGSLQRAGHGSGRYPVFSFHEDEADLHQAVRDTFVRVGEYPSDGRGLRLVCFDRATGEEYASLFGTGARTKRLAPSVLGLEVKRRRALLDGYIAGDGDWARFQHRFVTASADLASSVSLLAESLGIRATTYDERSDRSTIIRGKPCRSGPCVRGYLFDGAYRARPRFVEHEGRQYSLRRVKAVSTESYAGPVWDLTVDRRHSFQTPVGLVHNCVKPVALLDWVTRLICPVGGLVLDPFAGSASGGCGAVLAGRRYLGIEQDDLYVQTGLLRLAYWAAEAQRRFATCAS